MNKLTVNFTPCESAPSGGYDIFYKPVEGSAFLYAGNFTSAPAVFYDRANPGGTVYNGYIVARVASGEECPHISFTTGALLTGGQIINSTPFNGINSLFVSPPSDPPSALPIGTVSGLPIAAGTSTNGLLPSALNNTFCDVYVYTDPTAGTSVGLYLKVTDSDGNLICAAGSMVPVIVISSVRLSNEDNFTIELSNVPC